MNKFFAIHCPAVFLAIAVILAGAAFLRFAQLDTRPMHGDEANQAVKTGILLETGEYHYDPFEHHGPTLYYLELPILWLTGASDFESTQAWQYRLLPAIAGLLTVLLTLLLRRELGSGAVLMAALFTAVSHAMVYYSRYYVQESLFVLFALIMLIACWRFLTAARWQWAMALGLSIGLLHATKETCVLLFVALGWSVLITQFVGRRGAQRGGSFKAAGLEAERPSVSSSHAPSYVDYEREWPPLKAYAAPAALAFLCAAATSILFFSSFGAWWRGPLDSILTYWHYLHRAEGEGSTALHEQPFHYYISLLIHTQRTVGPRWTEAPALLFALFGTAIAFWPRRGARHSLFPRYLALYAWTLTLLFCLIPYKTPWNLLIFYHPLLLLAGYGAARTLASLRWRTAKALLALLLLGGLALMARQTWLGITLYSADVRNPYVYAHTSTALVRMAQRIHELQDLTPDNFQINVIKPNADYWPLPWYLRDLDQVGYWQEIPPTPDAAIIIADPELHPFLQPALKNQYFIEMYSLRPNVLLHLYIRQDLWDRFIASRS